MWLKGLLFVIPFLFASTFADAQSYNYQHYTTRDGLPGMMAYKVIQDKKGYVWVATDEGVSKYDGYRFHNFTVIDGLPNNDVLSIFEAPDGRLWLVTYQKGLAYIRNDSVYSHSLQEIEGSILGFDIDPQGMLWVTSNNHELYQYDFDRLIKHYKPKDFSGILTSILRGKSDTEGNIWLGIEDSLIKISNGIKTTYPPSKINEVNSHATPYISPKGKVYLHARNRIFYLTSQGELKVLIEASDFAPNASIVGISFASDDDLLIATNSGAFRWDLKANNIQHSYLAGKNVSCFMEDREGNYWFSTLNDGLYMLSYESTKVQNLNQANGLLADKAVALFAVNEKIFLSYAYNGLQQLVQSNDSYTAKNLPYHFMNQSMRECHQIPNNGLWCIGLSGILGLGNEMPGQSISPQWHQHLVDDSLEGFFDRKYNLINLGIIKASLYTPDSLLWVAAGTGLFSIDFHINSESYVVKRYFEHRVSSLAYSKVSNGVWFASANKLCYLDNGQAIVDSSLNTKTAITALAIAENNDKLIGTAGEGLLVLRATSMLQINTGSGLPSNVINAILPFRNGHLLSTSKGIYFLQADYSGYAVQMNNGIEGEVIIGAMPKDSSLFVLTNRGVSIAPQSLLLPDTTSVLKYITKVTIADNDTSVYASYTLPYNKNNIRLEYVGLSFKSNGNILYRYQMEGIDTGWVQTNFTNVQYPDLQPGRYTFKVDARSLQGQWSGKPVEMKITILPPYWQTGWFKLILALLLLGLVVLVVYLVVRYYRNQANIAKKMTLLEGQALRAQMNPHFIFNALNAIHDFIANSDERSAHLYLGKFALLVRKILNQSRQSEISLEEEIITLKLYMELEALRFPQQFEYSIECEDGLLELDTSLPPMLVQPYVENAIRHGLMNSARKGKLKVTFAKEGPLLKVTIEDNGVGRRKAQEMGSKRLKEHRSAGMEITQQRIALQQDKLKEDDITITDLYDEQGNAAGTSVVFYIPLSYVGQE